MRRHTWPPETDRLHTPRHEVRARSRAGSIDRLVDLQRDAGNAAVASMLAGPIVQRQPKPPAPPPQWLVDAQSTLNRLAASDPTLAKVVIKDYAGLNQELQSIDFNAWTNSATEIYVRDPSGFADPQQPSTKTWPAQIVRMILRHEGDHVHQFVAAGGHPKKWADMLKYEKEAYTNDIAWLAGAGAKEVPDPDLRKQFVQGAKKNVATITKILNGTKKLAPAAREVELHKRMIAAALIPAKSDPDPEKLYIQTP